MVHELKVHPDVWMDLWNETKTFEFRHNDRDFKVGHSLHLRRLDANGNMCFGMCDSIFRRVTYIIHGPSFGIPEGYCIMSIK